MVAIATSTQTKLDPRKQVAPIKKYSKINPTEAIIGNKNVVLREKPQSSHYHREINHLTTVYIQRKERKKEAAQILHCICIGVFIKAHISLANYIIK